LGTREVKQSFSTSEVADYCHVTADTIRKWAEAGRIHVFKTPGGHRRIRREDLLRFLRENHIPIHNDLAEEGIKILVVDGDSTTAPLITRFLERARGHFQVEIAKDGFDAGRKIASFIPDLVFLDLNLTGIDAVELCRRLKETPECAGLRIVGMTELPDGDISMRVMSAGAYQCMRKPFTPDDLRRCFAQLGIEVS
jgi:excisionase family DNA binding protein